MESNIQCRVTSNPEALTPVSLPFVDYDGNQMTGGSTDPGIPGQDECRGVFLSLWFPTVPEGTKGYNLDTNSNMF
jgi:hypothetical protein